MKSSCSLIKLIFNSIKKTKKTKKTDSLQCKQPINKVRNIRNKKNENKNQKLKKLIALPKKSTQDNKKKITNKYQELINNAEKKNIRNKKNKNKNQELNKLITFPERSIQDNKKKVTNRYQELIKNDEKLIDDTTKPKNISIKPMEQRLKYGFCSSCLKELDAGDWCKVCEAKKFEKNFKNWTSGHPEIDQLIRESQLNAEDGLDYFEWIDYKEIMDIEYITEDRFSKTFKGVWTKGPRHKVDPIKHNWVNIPNITIALKEMSEGMSFDQFLKKVQNHQKFLRNHENHVLRCFGISKSPKDDIETTKWLKTDIGKDSCPKKKSEKPRPNSYIMVMAWANDGDLFNYIKNKGHDENFTWYKRLEILEALSIALEKIHSKKIIHQDLHCGNILMDRKDKFQFPAISNLGLYGSYNQTEVPKGIISFIAPEHLKGNPEPFTAASDIYSFGIIMWVICYCKLPYKEHIHDSFALLINIVGGCHPEISKNIPITYADLMRRCWDNDSKNRPKASELRDIFLKWKNQCYINNNEFFIAEKERLNRIKNPDLFEN